VENPAIDIEDVESRKTAGFLVDGIDLWCLPKSCETHDVVEW